MGKRKGSFLEEIVSGLFQKAGFETSLNNWVEGYEIDVLAKKEGHKIAIECKQFERSRLIIRNLIHQWASKLQFIHMDKAVIVLVGQKPSKEDYDLARNLGIVIIDDEKLHELNSIMDKDELNGKIDVLISFPKENLIRRDSGLKIAGIVLLSFLAFLIYLYLLKNFLIILFGIIFWICFIFLMIYLLRRLINWKRRK